VTLRAGGVDVTPPNSTRSIRMDRAPPRITSVRINRGSSTVEVEVKGYSTPRDLTQAVFRFSGANLQTTELTVPLTTPAANWFRGSASSPYGSMFTYTQTFQVSQGSPAGVNAVTVTLANSSGTSQEAGGN